MAAAKKKTDSTEVQLIAERASQKGVLVSYEERTASETLRDVARANKVPWKMFSRWLANDARFVQELDEIDNRRIRLVRNIFVGALEETAAKTLDIARGDGKNALKAQQLIYEVAGVMAGRRGGGVNVFNKIEVNQQAAEVSDVAGAKAKLDRIKAQIAEFEDVPKD